MSETAAAAARPFTLNIETLADATVVRCSGRLMGESGNILRNEVKPLIAPGRRLVIDLTNVTHSDSMGLGAVISLYVSSKSAGCRLELVNMGQKILQLFSMANLLS